MPRKEKSYTYSIGGSTNKASGSKNTFSLSALSLSKSSGNDSLGLVPHSGIHESGKHSKKCSGACTE